MNCNEQRLEAAVCGELGELCEPPYKKFQHHAQRETIGHSLPQRALSIVLQHWMIPRGDSYAAFYENDLPRLRNRLIEAKLSRLWSLNSTSLNCEELIRFREAHRIELSNQYEHVLGFLDEKYLKELCDELEGMEHLEDSLPRPIDLTNLVSISQQII
jgi:hypothetical protein